MELCLRPGGWLSALARLFAAEDPAPQSRAAVHLFYYEGLSTRQIASVLDRSEATIRSDLHRGREQLKRILKEAYDFEV